MSNTLLVTLRPFDYYFFGGEETFNSGAKGMVNFQVKSNLLPQQTGLLGLLRHTLLTAGYPIGDSFNGTYSNFGAIKGISPLMLKHSNGELFAPAPNMYSPDGTNISVGISPGIGKVFLDNTWQDSTISAPGFDPKKGLEGFWANMGTGELTSTFDIFSTCYHTGIDKQKRIKNKEGDGGFFRQQFVNLHKDYSFAFYATFNEEINIVRFPKSLPFGGEKRLFALGFTEVGANAWDNILQQYSNALKAQAKVSTCLFFLSDAWIPEPKEFVSQITFGTIQEQPFRNLITPSNSVSFGSFNKEPATHPNKLYKPSKASYLVKRGSVIWFNETNKNAIEAHLNQPIYKTIGYNHYIIF